MRSLSLRDGCCNNYLKDSFFSSVIAPEMFENHICIIVLQLCRQSVSSAEHSTIEFDISQWLSGFWITFETDRLNLQTRTNRIPLLIIMFK